ncbi:MAG TPA: hypothetical protein PK275_04080 [Chitinophagaceae bacterium]|nr:hypothetical protein [Chitinophagaceae bacterium]
MIYLIYPSDETTEFLLEIPKRIAEKHGEKSIQVIQMLPSEESYKEVFQSIEAIPSGSVVIFMGHGQEEKLWGAENESFVKQSFVSKSQAKVFSEKFIFLLSCNSNDFIKGTFSFSKAISSIGFGSLPTEMAEVEKSKRLKEQGVNEETINKYKNSMIELVSDSFCDMIESKLSFSQLGNSFLLRLNKKMSQVILEDTKSKDNRILADLLFQMKSEMVFI